MRCAPALRLLRALRGSFRSHIRRCCVCWSRVSVLPGPSVCWRPLRRFRLLGLPNVSVTSLAAGLPVSRCLGVVRERTCGRGSWCPCGHACLRLSTPPSDACGPLVWVPAHSVICFVSLALVLWSRLSAVSLVRTRFLPPALRHSSTAGHVLAFALGPALF